MEGCSAAPKKISLNIRGSGKKSAFNKDLVQHDTEVKEETDYVTEGSIAIDLQVLFDDTIISITSTSGVI